MVSGINIKDHSVWVYSLAESLASSNYICSLINPAKSAPMLYNDILEFSVWKSY